MVLVFFRVHFKVALGVLTDKQGVEIYFFKWDERAYSRTQNVLKATKKNCSQPLDVSNESKMCRQKGERERDTASIESRYKFCYRNAHVLLNAIL